MARAEVLRDGEVVVVRVTPVARGVVRPAVVTIGLVAALVVGAQHSSIVHRYAGWLFVLTAAPAAVVFATRFWRWRSHKIVVTDRRVFVEGGVITHFQFSVEFSEVVATRVERRLGERLTRRGVVILETIGGSIMVGKVRHPSALGRLIDAERHKGPPDPTFRDGFFGGDGPPSTTLHRG